MARYHPLVALQWRRPADHRPRRPRSRGVEKRRRRRPGAWCHCSGVTRRNQCVARDVVSAYTLILGDEYGPATVGVYPSAEEAWKALDREGREKCKLRVRPPRAARAGATGRLADAWRAGNAEERFWQILSHQLAVRIPEIGRQRALARRPELARR